MLARMPQAWAGEFAHTIFMTLAYLSAMSLLINASV
jgi:hypothetical protein